MSKVAHTVIHHEAQPEITLGTLQQCEKTAEFDHFQVQIKIWILLFTKST